MKNISEIIFELINNAVKEQGGKYSILLEQLPYVKVSSIEFTGVGGFINLDVDKSLEVDKDKFKHIGNINLPTTPLIKVDSLQDGLQFEVVVEEGLLKMIELVTWEKNWNGSFDGFQLVNT